MVTCHFNFQFQVLAFFKRTKELGLVHFIVDVLSSSSFPSFMPLIEALQLIALSQAFHYIILALPSFPCVMLILILILSCLVRVFRACGLTIPSLHVESMSRNSFSAIPHVQCQGFRLVPWVPLMLPHFSRPLPLSSSLGMDIKFRSPWSIFVRVIQASIVFANPGCFEVKGVVSFQISLRLHNARFE